MSYVENYRDSKIKQNSLAFPDIVNIPTGRCHYSYDEESINECIRLSLLTARGELFGDPMYGSMLYELIFESNDFILRDQIAQEILRVVGTYEPRVSMTEDDIVTTSDDEMVYVVLRYKILMTGQYGELSLQFLKNDYRNIFGVETIGME